MPECTLTTKVIKVQKTCVLIAKCEVNTLNSKRPQQSQNTAMTKENTGYNAPRPKPHEHCETQTKNAREHGRSEAQPNAYVQNNMHPASPTFF